MNNTTLEISKKLDANVLSVISNNTLAGFEKAYHISNAIVKLKSLLTPEYMQPIMALSGNKLGFKTDRDNKPEKYSEEVVKNCLIEAVLMGLQPYGNQFNIIAGNMYPTKEGLGFRLNNFAGLKYDIVCGLPRVSGDKTSAAVDAHIKWTINGESSEKTVPIPIKIDQYASVDSIIGKATRKGRAWLLSTVSGIEITDGEVTDVEAKVVETKINKVDDRINRMIASATTVEELENFASQVELSYEQIELLNKKKAELKAVKK